MMILCKVILSSELQLGQRQQTSHGNCDDLRAMARLQEVIEAAECGNVSMAA